jgi:hypothetical protein
VALWFLLVASQAIHPPLIGCLHESPAIVRCVYGVAGAFVLGPAIVNEKRVSTQAQKTAIEDGTRLSIESQDLVVIRQDGGIDRLPAPPCAESIESMGNGWFHLAGARRIVRVSADGVQIYVLPRESSQ